MKDDYNLKVGDIVILHPNRKYLKKVKIVGFAHGGRSAIVHGIDGSPEECQIELKSQLVPLNWVSQYCTGPWYPQDRLISLTYAC